MGAPAGAKNAYYKERREAIKNGTWEPRKPDQPRLTPTPLDWAWAAGFIEGEGSIRHTGKSSQRVECGQKHKEPLERLHALFGGTLRLQTSGRTSPLWMWSVNGGQARYVIQGVYSLLSARRRAQADRAMMGG